jgi:hypothetical protein
VGYIRYEKNSGKIKLEEYFPITTKKKVIFELQFLFREALWPAVTCSWRPFGHRVKISFHPSVGGFHAYVLSYAYREELRFRFTKVYPKVSGLSQ